MQPIAFIYSFRWLFLPLDLYHPLLIAFFSVTKKPCGVHRIPTADHICYAAPSLSCPRICPSDRCTPRASGEVVYRTVVDAESRSPSLLLTDSGPQSRVPTKHGRRSCSSVPIFCTPTPSCPLPTHWWSATREVVSLLLVFDRLSCLTESYPWVDQTDDATNWFGWS